MLSEESQYQANESVALNFTLGGGCLRWISLKSYYVIFSDLTMELYKEIAEAISVLTFAKVTCGSLENIKVQIVDPKGNLTSVLKVLFLE